MSSDPKKVAQIISPVDGRVYAERPLATPPEVAGALTAAHAAQREWRAATVDERAAVCRRAVDAMNAMSDEIIVELAWQMGRRCATAPVSYAASPNGPCT
jgi:acyl-CoA reductase-like NAD-dependent aldehyde dehydrogenase